MQKLLIKTAGELGDSAIEERADARRTARETPVLRAVLRLFADMGGPVVVSDVAESLPDVPPATIARAMAALNDDDLLVLRGDRIELAYPFSTAPTPFVVRRVDGRERFTCCAIDALGIAPMMQEHVEVATRCHHCDSQLRFSVSPDGPLPPAADVMVWVTRLRPDDGRACAVL